MNRTQASLKNFIWSAVSMFATTLLNFVLRTILIKTLGSVYLGINGLFANVLGLLSFAELGIGTAISFSLYKPLAENDQPKIKALINFYRKAYRIVALIVLVIGVSLIPFLPKIAKGSEGVEHLVFIYCIYIFNTVTSYLITYKSTIISADQKNYLITNINIVTNIIIVIFQSLELLIFKNYIFYLLISAAISLVKNIYINLYTVKKYPYLKGSNKEKLTSEEKTTIFTKIKALLYHKVGEVVIFQTDNIITSTIINVTMVGLVSNYTMVINVIKNLVQTFYSSIIPSFGNLIATGDNEYQYKVFKRLNFLGYWINSFTAVCLYFLLAPFVKIWLGEEFLINNYVVLLLAVNYYMQVMRTPVSTVKNAAGVFEPDKFSPVIESVVNLAVSIVLALRFGIIGVYVGTFVSAFIPTIWRPIVVFKNVFKLPSKLYFADYFKSTLIMLGYCAAMTFLFNYVSFTNNFVNLGFRAIICLVVPNLCILIFYGKTSEFKYAVGLVKRFSKSFVSKIKR